MSLCSVSSRARRPIIAALLALTLLPGAGGAEEMVPADLVLELVKSAPRFGAGEPSLIVGEVPGELSALLALPEEFEVLLSLLWGEATSVIGETELSRAQLGGRLEGGLAERGWSRFRPEANSRGFQPSAEETGLVFCREDGDTLVVEVVAKSAEVSRARLSHRKGHGVSSCDRLARYARTEDPFGEEVPFPTLYPPDGSKSSGGGGSAGEFARTARTRLETDLAPAEILVHYATQLGQQGWQPDTRVEYDSLAYQSWLFLDESGNEWHGLLLVGIDPRDRDERDLELRVTYLVPN